MSDIGKPDPQSGDRVRVTIEGVVRSVFPSRIFLCADDSAHLAPLIISYDSSAADMLAVEVLERFWQVGDVALYRSGTAQPVSTVVMRTEVANDVFWRDCHGNTYSDTGLLPSRLTLLVRDGKPVTGGGDV